MPLQSGARLGPYEIVAPLGAGGMGEVYRARDGTLNRDVAIKVLLASVADDPDRLARFRREAQVLASLNHPNIAHIHGLEDFPIEGGGHVRALVMELVEGDDLAVLIARGPMPLDEALPIAKQMADALEAAHEQGIIHRDLKPANIKVRPDGTVKVLDFGLAKAMDPAGASRANVMNSPTLSIHATQAGMILGTAAYMSPEQARGKSVDRRADIWAFGAVLFEMLTGARPFPGDDVTDTIVSVVSKEPDWSALPPSIPLEVRRLLVRCLKKDPKSRMRDIGEARIAIDEGMSGALPIAAPEGSSAGVAVPVIARRKLRERAAWIVVAAIASMAAAAAAWWAKPAPAVAHVIVRFAYPLPEGQAFTRPGRHNVALSPDGTKLAYIANRQIYLRHLDRLDAQPLPGTDEDPIDLVFSPDSQWIAYFALSAGGVGGMTLNKIAVAGGVPVKLCATDFPFGVTWRDGTIVFGQNSEGKALVRAVVDTGGAIRTLVSLDQGQIAHPQLLADGKHLLYSWRPAGSEWAGGEIVVHTLESGARKVVLRGGADGRLLPTGHLVYVRDGTLLAVAFSVARLETIGESVSVLDGVRTSGAAGISGAAQFTLSSTGTLAYAPGGAAGATRTLVWVDRHGREQAIGAPARAYRYPRLSPDGTRLAVDIEDQESDIWTWDLAREQLMRLTFGPAVDFYPLWLPDGRSLLYSEGTGGNFDIFRKAADNTGSAIRLTRSASSKYANSLSADGRLLVYREGEPREDFNLFLLALDGSRPPQPLFRTTFNELNAEISPDGRWLAYQSNESGKDEVYVRPFPAVDESRTQVSAGGGADPVWSRTGRELFHATGKDPTANATGKNAGAKLVGVRILPTPPGGTFSFGKPEPLFALSPYYLGLSGRSFDVAPDGQRFLMIKLPPPSQQFEGLVVVSHWFDELKGRVPIK